MLLISQRIFVTSLIPGVISQYTFSKGDKTDPFGSPAEECLGRVINYPSLQNRLISISENHCSNMSYQNG